MAPGMGNDRDQPPMVFLLLSLGTMSNVVYTCTVPLVGFGAIAGATLPVDGH
ncbi:MAG: hypothetical protein HC780_25935 [Leptolyngbyaceae cyanobacterium CSU_1_3]|nr:hypothetical protein [Leptolyngbyaceae cyanobacterium CSU_1_3]